MRFTIRDWLWMCVVLFLAFGWGAHFRYTRYKDNPVTWKPPPSTDELELALAKANAYAQEEQAKYRAMQKALRETSLAMLQRQEMDLKVKEFLATEAPWLTPAQKERIEDQLHITLFTPDEIKQMEPDWYDKRMERVLKSSDKSQLQQHESANSN